MGLGDKGADAGPGGQVGTQDFFDDLVVAGEQFRRGLGHVAQFLDANPSFFDGGAEEVAVVLFLGDGVSAAALHHDVDRFVEEGFAVHQHAVHVEQDSFVTGHSW